MLFCTKRGSVGWAPKGHSVPVHLHFSPKDDLLMLGSCALELITFRTSGQLHRRALSEWCGLGTCPAFRSSP